MTARILASLLTLLLASLGGGADAPALGGRYVGDVSWKGERCRGCVTLNVANDGQSFQGESYVELDGLRRLPSNCGGYFTVLSGEPGQYLIDPSGYFRGTTRERGRWGRVVGRFGDEGRVVSGYFVFRERSRPCRVRARATFRARLVGRPNRPRPERFVACDSAFEKPFGTGDRADVFDRGVGCTAAIDAARHLTRDAACQSLALGQSCAAGRLHCTAIAQGERDPAAQARCARVLGESAVAEIVSWEECRSRGGDDDLYAANLTCRAARDLVDDLYADTDCGGEACTVGRFRCRVIGEDDVSIVTRCDDAHRSMEIRSYG